jgi:hypothetical protein
MEGNGDAGLVRAAARNNAEWCDVVVRLHGLSGAYHDGGWSVPRRPPPFYPDAVTLDADANVDGILSAIDLSPGCSVKDSFANVDLSAHGFDVAFEAQWIHRPADERPLPPGADARWERVREASGLREWQRAWNGGDASPGIFRPDLLLNEDVVVLAGIRDGRIDAGAIANRGSVVGLSNVFVGSGDPDATWRGAVAAAAARFEGLPFVGYERGDALEAARRCGFTSLAPLRVWTRSGASEARSSASA